MKPLGGAVPLGAAYFICGLAFLAVVLGAAIHIPFAHHDQYRFFIEDGHRPEEMRKHREADTQYRWLQTIGRPLAAEMEYRVFQHSYVVSDLTDARIGMLLLTSALVAFWALWLTRLGLAPVTAFAASAATFVLPPSQFSAIMTSYNHPVGQLLGLAAAWVAGQATLPRSAVVGRLAYVRMGASIIVATGLFVLGLLSYPPSVFVFLLPAPATAALRGIGGWSSTRWMIVRDLAVAAAGSVIYFLMGRLIFQSHVPADFPSDYRLQVASGLAGRLDRFVHELSPTIFSLWCVPPNGAISACVACFVLSGAVVMGIQIFQRVRGDAAVRRRARRMVEWSFAIVAPLLASEISYLLSPSKWMLYRMHFVYGAMIVTLILGAVKSWTTFLPRPGRARAFMVPVVGLCLFAAVAANRLCLTSCLNDHMELSFIATQLASHLDQKRPLSRIHVIQPERSDYGYNGIACFSADEFNHNSLEHPQYVHCVVRRPPVYRETGVVPDHSCGQYAGGPSPSSTRRHRDHHFRLWRAHRPVPRNGRG